MLHYPFSRSPVRPPRASLLLSLLRPLSGRNILLAAALQALCTAHATAAGIATHRWDIQTDRPAQYTLELYRGETINLEPRYVEYGDPLTLTNVTSVVMRYRGESTPAGYYHALTGSVVSAAAGRIRIPWTPDAETPDAVYQYTIVAATAQGSTMRGVGSIRMRDTVAGAPASVPDWTLPIDWAIVEHINLDSAPFLFPGADGIISAIQAGTGIDVTDGGGPTTTVAIASATHDLITGAVQGTDAEYLATVAHAQSGHGVTDEGGFYGGADAAASIGGAIGFSATTTEGGAAGESATSLRGGAIGANASASLGGAVGDGASAVDGGAVGVFAKTSDGFAGGAEAYATTDGTQEGAGIDAVQLGGGGNTVPGSLGVYAYLLMGADGIIPIARLSGITSNQIDAATDEAYRTGGAAGTITDIEAGTGIHIADGGGPTSTVAIASETYTVITGAVQRTDIVYTQTVALASSAVQDISHLITDIQAGTGIAVTDGTGPTSTVAIASETYTVITGAVQRAGDTMAGNLDMGLHTLGIGDAEIKYMPESDWPLSIGAAFDAPGAYISTIHVPDALSMFPDARILFYDLATQTEIASISLNALLDTLDIDIPISAANYYGGAAGTTNAITPDGIVEISDPLAKGVEAHGWGNHADPVFPDHQIHAVAGTATITRTMPVAIRLVATNSPTVITMDMAGYGSDSAIHLLNLHAGTNSISFATNTIHGATSSPSTNAYDAITLMRAYDAPTFEARQP